MGDDSKPLNLGRSRHVAPHVQSRIDAFDRAKFRTTAVYSALGTVTLAAGFGVYLATAGALAFDTPLLEQLAHQSSGLGREITTALWRDTKITTTANLDDRQALRKPAENVPEVPQDNEPRNSGHSGVPEKPAIAQENASEPGKEAVEAPILPKAGPPMTGATTSEVSAPAATATAQEALDLAGTPEVPASPASKDSSLETEPANTSVPSAAAPATQAVAALAAVVPAGGAAAPAAQPAAVQIPAPEAPAAVPSPAAPAAPVATPSAQAPVNEAAPVAAEPRTTAGSTDVAALTPDKPETRVTERREPECVSNVRVAAQQTVVLFELGSATVPRVLVPAIARLGDMISACDAAQIEISGHTDPIGQENSNFSLSWRRAEEVGKILSSRGVLASQHQYFGYGARQPLATEVSKVNNANKAAKTNKFNKAAGDSSLHRRVEIRVR